MKFAIIQLDNTVVGIKKRLEMTEKLIQQAAGAEFVVLPELSTCGYIPTHEIWKYREFDGERTKAWAIRMA